MKRGINIQGVAFGSQFSYTSFLRERYVGCCILLHLLHERVTMWLKKDLGLRPSLSYGGNQDILRSWESLDQSWDLTGVCWLWQLS